MSLLPSSQSCKLSVEFPFRMSLPADAWDHSDTDMFGIQVFIGHWISSSSKVTTYKPNFDNFAKILEHPGPEIEKMFPDIVSKKIVHVFFSIVRSLSRKLFDGQLVMRWKFLFSVQSLQNEEKYNGASLSAVLPR